MDKRDFILKILNFNLGFTSYYTFCLKYIRGGYREYYMVARKYEIYFECEQDISRVSAANECDVLFKTRNKALLIHALYNRLLSYTLIWTEEWKTQIRSMLFFPHLNNALSLRYYATIVQRWVQRSATFR